MVASTRKGRTASDRSAIPGRRRGGLTAMPARRAAPRKTKNVKPRGKGEKRPPSGRKPYVRKQAYAPTEAKAWFPEICREVASDGERRVYIDDRQGERLVTLDPVKRNLRGPVLEVPVQRFKTEFSRFCALVRIGVCFRLTRRGTAPVYARRHTGYRDPLDTIVDKWRNALVNRKIGRLSDAYEKLADLDERRVQETAERRREDAQRDRDIDDLKRGQETNRTAIARVALGHFPPFKKGLPNDPAAEA